VTSKVTVVHGSWATVSDLEVIRTRAYSNLCHLTDHRLLGLLWGWDNGNLLFTPIQDVFADIAQKMRVDMHLIKLPEYPSPHSRQGSLLSRRSNGTLRYKFPCRSDRPVELPVTTPQQLQLPISNEEKRNRRRSSGADSAFSNISTPSLISSASSFVEGASTSGSPAEGPSTPSVMSAMEHGINETLPMRPEARVLTNEAIEEWVCIPYDDDPIEEKFSALQLATDDMTYTRA
jgi:hypothetical protein